MPDYDPTTVALMDDLLTALAPQAGPAGLSYEETLRHVQRALTEALQDSEYAPDPGTEQVLRQALGQLDAKSDDRWLGLGEVLRRVLSAVDRQLFIWTSSLVQPPGPSGDSQVALTEESPSAEVLKPV